MSIINRTLLGTALFATSTFGLFGIGCAHRQYEPTAYEHEIRFSDDYDRPAHYLCSQEEGERMIAELAKSCGRKDAWIYRVRDSKGVWIDVGGKSERENIQPSKGEIKSKLVFRLYSICVRTDLLDEFLQKGDDVTFYYVHPYVSRLELELEQFPSFENDEEYTIAVPFEDGDQNETENGNFLAKLKDLLACGRQLPTIDEYKLHVWFKRTLGNEGVKVNPSKIVSDRTIASFDCDERKSDSDIEKELEPIYKSYFFKLRGLLNRWED